MKDEVTVNSGSAWAVAGILTHLEGAVLTTSVGDGGLAGTIEMAEMLLAPANDPVFGGMEGELG